MSDIFGNVIAFIVAVGVIIFVHEAGHLLAAKGFGIRVHTFSLGFGKRLWGFRRGETEYRVAAIPLGGYVRLGGEDPDEASDDPRDFVNRPRWQRVLVYLAGPAMNVVLAIVLVAGVFMIGVEGAALREIPPVVGGVAEGSPAEAAGIRPGDRIEEAAGRVVERWEQVHFAIVTSPERPLELGLVRDGERLRVTVVPARVPDHEWGEAGLVPRVLPRITQVLAGSPAAGAGFAAGDEIRTVDGRAIGGTADFVSHIEERAGELVEVGVDRAGERVRLTVRPAADEEGKGRIGVALGIYQRYGPGEAIVESVRYNVEIIQRIGAVLGKMITGELAARAAVSGPIEIAAVSGAAARQGLLNFVYLMAIISISIGVLNLLPIPVLDGGHIVILALESTIRRDLPVRLKERINQVGFFLLILIMVTVIYFDLAKTLPGLFRSS